MGFNDLADLAIKATQSTFGEPIVYKHGAVTEVIATGIFDLTTDEVDPGTGLLVVMEKPRLTVRIADLNSTPLKDDTVVVRGIEYTVSEPPIKNGHGEAELQLQL